MTDRRRRHDLDGPLLYVGTRAVATVHGEFTAHLWQNLASRDHVLALASGDLAGREPVLARVHSSCVTSESYGSCDCDCAAQLGDALAAIARAGRGVVFYLMQEGRGAGFIAKARDRMMVQASGNRLSTFDAYARMGLANDRRSYDEVACAYQALGIAAPLVLLTNNPDKVRTLERAGVAVARTMPLRRTPSAFNVHYLSAKSRRGHTLLMPRGARAAQPPERVAYSPPRALPEASHLVHVASYFMPIALPAAPTLGGKRKDAPRRARGEHTTPHWFRLHAYVDLAAGRERVVLTYGDPTCGLPLLRVQSETLLERFPLRDGGGGRERWVATVRAFVRQGAGCAVMGSAAGCDGFLPVAGAGRPVPARGRKAGAKGPAVPAGADGGDAMAALLAHHVRSGSGRLVADGPRESEADRTLRQALERRGVTTERSFFLTS